MFKVAVQLDTSRRESPVRFCASLVLFLWRELSFLSHQTVPRQDALRLQLLPLNRRKDVWRILSGIVREREPVEHIAPMVLHQIIVYKPFFCISVCSLSLTPHKFASVGVLLCRTHPKGVRHKIIWVPSSRSARMLPSRQPISAYPPIRKRFKDKIWSCAEGGITAQTPGL